MYTFKREEIVDKQTGNKKFRDHYEMVSGERRMLPNGAIQEEVKAGHVEPAMLQDKEFCKAYMDFFKALPDEMLSEDELASRTALKALAEKPAELPAPAVEDIVEGDEKDEE